MSALVDFLLARIAEDEAAVSPYVGSRSPSRTWVTTRVLAECEAKRKVVELVDLANAPSIDSIAWVWAKSACMALATVYADHPDYREEWRPSAG